MDVEVPAGRAVAANCNRSDWQTECGRRQKKRAYNVLDRGPGLKIGRW